MTVGLDWTGGRCRFPTTMFKRAFKPVARAPEPDAPIVTAYTDGQVTLRSNRSKIGYHEAADTSTYKGVRRGDFVVHGLDILRGSVGVSDSDGAISPVCTVCVPKDDVHAPFMAYAMRAQAFAGVPRAWARGVREGGADFRRWDTLGELPVPLPGVEKQRQIADFLDDQVAVLDRAIGLRQRQAELEEERFRARLDEVIRAALDGPFVSTPLKYLARVVDTEHKTAPHVPGGGYWVAGTRAIRDGRLIVENLYETDAAAYAEWTARARPRPGDLVLTREAPVGEVALLRDGDARICIGQRVVLIQLRAGLLSEMLLLVLMSPNVARFYADVTQGSLHPHLNMRDLGAIPIPFAEQRMQSELVDVLSAEFEAVRGVTSLMMRSLKLLHERKWALIAAAVTGEFDAAAARNIAVA